MAFDLNQVSLLGRLGKDPEIRQTNNGDPVANLSVATSESWRDKNSGEKREKTEWHRVVIFGPLAEVAQKFLSKGDQVYLQGKLVTRKWQDQSGNDRYTTEVQVSGFGAKLIMCGSSGGSGSRGDSGGDDYDTAKHQADHAAASDDLDDSIPF